MDHVAIIRIVRDGEHYHAVIEVDGQPTSSGPWRTVPALLANAAGTVSRSHAASVDPLSIVLGQTDDSRRYVP